VKLDAEEEDIDRELYDEALQELAEARAQGDSRSVLCDLEHVCSRWKVGLAPIEAQLEHAAELHALARQPSKDLEDIADIYLSNALGYLLVARVLIARDKKDWSAAKQAGEDLLHNAVNSAERFAASLLLATVETGSGELQQAESRLAEAARLAKTESQDKLPDSSDLDEAILLLKHEVEQAEARLGAASVAGLKVQQEAFDHAFSSLGRRQKWASRWSCVTLLGGLAALLWAVLRALHGFGVAP
jgi:hypothetical protein